MIPLASRLSLAWQQREEKTTTGVCCERLLLFDAFLAVCMRGGVRSASVFISESDHFWRVVDGPIRNTIYSSWETGDSSGGVANWRATAVGLPPPQNRLQSSLFATIKDGSPSASFCNHHACSCATQGVRECLRFRTCIQVLDKLFFAHCDLRSDVRPMHGRKLSKAAGTPRPWQKRTNGVGGIPCIRTHQLSLPYSHAAEGVPLIPF